jgi:hypothetical protein
MRLITVCRSLGLQTRCMRSCKEWHEHHAGTNRELIRIKFTEAESLKSNDSHGRHICTLSHHSSYLQSHILTLQASCGLSFTFSIIKPPTFAVPEFCPSSLPNLEAFNPGTTHKSTSTFPSPNIILLISSSFIVPKLWLIKNSSSCTVKQRSMPQRGLA